MDRADGPLWVESGLSTLGKTCADLKARSKRNRERGEGLDAVIAGFCVVGLGLANMVPAVFSASAAAASSPSLGIAMAATLAYASNLIGPPIFGAVASVSSLRAAFAMLLPVSLAILALACVQRRRLSSDL